MKNAMQELIDQWGWETDKGQLPYRAFQTVEFLVRVVRYHGDELEKLRQQVETLGHDLERLREE